MLVIPSPLTPESSAANKTGAAGVAGAVVRIVNEVVPLVGPGLPATLSSATPSTYVPSASGDEGVIVYDPVGETVAVPITVLLPAFRSWIVPFASAVPVSRGCLTFVTPSP